MYHLRVLTAEEVFYEDEVISLIAPGKLGYLGVLTDHAPLLTTLKAGPLLITDKNRQTHRFELKGGGILEVNKNNVSLLIDSTPSRV